MFSSVMAYILVKVFFLMRVRIMFFKINSWDENIEGNILMKIYSNTFIIPCVGPLQGHLLGYRGTGWSIPGILCKLYHNWVFNGICQPPGYVSELWWLMDEETLISSEIISTKYIWLFEKNSPRFYQVGRDVAVYSCILTYIQFAAQEIALGSQY